MPTIEPSFDIRLVTTRIVAGEGVARENRTGVVVFAVLDGTTYDVEYDPETEGQVLLIDEGEPLSAEGAPASLDVPICEPVHRLVPLRRPRERYPRRRAYDDHRIEVHHKSSSVWAAAHPATLR